MKAESTDEAPLKEKAPKASKKTRKHSGHHHTHKKKAYENDDAINAPSETTEELDEKLLELEAETMAKEREYLLTKEAVGVFDRIGKELTLCIQALRPPKDKEAADDKAVTSKTNTKGVKFLGIDALLEEERRKQQEAVKRKKKEKDDDKQRIKATAEPGVYDDESSRVISFQSKGEKVLKGYVIFDGWNISEAEATTHFLKQKHVELLDFKTTIRKQFPFICTQLQNAYNYVKFAKESLNLMRSGELKTLEEYREVIMKMIKSLRQAQQQLRTAEVKDFPMGLENPLVFSPSLPSELLLDIGIDKLNLEITAYLFNFTASGPTAKKEKKETTDTARLGQSYRKKGRWATLVDVIRVSSKVPKILDANNFLSTCVREASELSMKINSLIN